MKKEKYYSISKKKILDFGIFIFVGLLLFIFISSFFSEMQAFFYTISGYVFLITFNKLFGSIFNETHGYVNVICVKCGKEKRIGLNKSMWNS